MSNPIKFTRAQYMANECDHHTYYAQFATPGVISLVTMAIGKAKITNSTNEHFNDIPLQKWGNLKGSIGAMVGNLLCDSNASTSAGHRGYSLSDTVYVAKAAARMIKEQA